MTVQRERSAADAASGRLPTRKWTGSAALVGLLLTACTTTATPPASSAIVEAPVDGGSAFYEEHRRTFTAKAAAFPIGTWLASVTSEQDVLQDQSAGLNTYVALTPDSDLALPAAAEMTVLLQVKDWADRVPPAQPGVGWLLADEVDMTDGPGDGYERLDQLRGALDPSDGRVRYNNYGKGVLFWHGDEDAGRFVNDYQDIVSTDAYWFTDRNICGVSEGPALVGTLGLELPAEHCHRASNYGRTVDRVRDLVRPAGSKPVWVFVELGHTFEEPDWPQVRPAQATAAVWSGIVHGARGVVYFNHSFGGEHVSYNILRDPAYADVREAVTATNRRITALAPILAANSITGLVRAPATVDMLVKRMDDRLYVFVVAAEPHPGEVTFRLPCRTAGEVTVLDEGRALPLEDGAFRDTFADAEAVHLYELPRGSTCGRA